MCNCADGVVASIDLHRISAASFVTELSEPSLDWHPCNFVFCERFELLDVRGFVFDFESIWKSKGGLSTVFIGKSSSNGVLLTTYRASLMFDNLTEWDNSSDRADCMILFGHYLTDNARLSSKMSNPPTVLFWRHFEISTTKYFFNLCVWTMF